MTIDLDSATLKFGGTKVTITTSAGIDDAVVVFIDTHYEPDGSDGAGIRVYLNEDPVYEGVSYREPSDDPPTQPEGNET